VRARSVRVQVAITRGVKAGADCRARTSAVAYTRVLPIAGRIAPALLKDSGIRSAPRRNIHRRSAYNGFVVKRRKTRAREAVGGARVAPGYGGPARGRSVRRQDHLMGTGIRQALPLGLGGPVRRGSLRGGALVGKPSAQLYQ